MRNANMAWSILSVVPNVRSSYTLHIHFDLNLSQSILAQVDRDSSIVRLVAIMDVVFSFVQEAEPMSHTVRSLNSCHSKPRSAHILSATMP
jgi:hypothetical protein